MGKKWIFVLALLLLSPSGLRAEGWRERILPQTLRGEPFSNPDEGASKPQEWIRQPIRHKEQDKDGEVVVLLDQNNYPGLLPLIQEFAQIHEMNVVVREGTCGPAFEGINRKEVDIGGSCCPAARADRLPELRWHTVGIAPLAILANGADPVEGLTSHEVREIFGGRLTLWSQIPALAEKFPKDQPIQPVIRFHCKTRPGHWRLILDNEDLFGPRSNEVGSMLDMVTNVARRPGTLGYEENWHTINHPKFKETLKAIPIDGHAPTDGKALLAGRYPFYFVYNLSTWTSDHTANPKADKLVAYLMDNAGRIDPSYHVVPSSELRKAGWKFRGDELIGEP
ncbi:MAG: hypothetical protein HQL95_09985 [Magnetococcales bacterium]|nr:hypothetical protein [Magnetococcales bacterium]